MERMSREDFFEYAKDHIKEYLPPSYREAEVSLSLKHKNNDVTLHGLTVKNQGEQVVPMIYLDDFFDRYENGTDLSELMSGIADIRLSHTDPGFVLNTEEMKDYQSVRDKLQIHLCDPEHNREYLKGKVYSIEGDFAAVYRMSIVGNGQVIGSAAVTPAFMETWGIEKDTLRRDALAAEAARRPMLVNVMEMADYELFGTPVKNLLEEDGRDAAAGDPKTQLLCLTNSQKMYGSSLIMDQALMDRVGEILGHDFYVLPSSVHEVMILPDNAPMGLDELSKMVVYINRHEVAPEDFLSDNVQHYDRGSHQLENAGLWKQRMEAEKKNERAAVPEGREKKKSEMSQKSVMEDAKRRPSVLDKLHQAQKNVSQRERAASPVTRKKVQEL